MKSEFIIRNQNRKPPQMAAYEPEHIRLGIDPHRENVNPDEMRNAILMNSQTLGALSRRGSHSAPAEVTTGLPNPNVQKLWVSQAGIEGAPKLMSVAKQSWESTGDVLADEIIIPAQYQEPFRHQEQQAAEEVNSPETLQSVPAGHFCIAVKDSLISVETKEKALEVIEYILDGEDDQFDGVVLGDIVLLKSIPIKFGFHCGE